MVGIAVPILVAIIGVVYHEKSSGPVVIDHGGVTPPPVIPHCSAKLSDEHDDALKAVHIYDQGITTSQARLDTENAALASAQEAKDDYAIAEHKSLASLAESQMKSQKESRDEAMQRVRDIEKQCIP